MKRFLSIILCIGMLSISACSKETTITKASENNTGSNPSEVVVDEGLLTVTITIPADLVGETTQDELDKSINEKGFKSVTLNSDGSATYVMTKSKHKQILKEFADNFDKGFQDIINSGESPNIISITHNDNFTDFKVEYNGEEVSFEDSFIVITFYYAGGYYGAFSGSRPDNVHVVFVNSKTGKTIQESNSKDLVADTNESTEKNDNEKLLDISNDVTDYWNEVVVQVSHYASSGTSSTGGALDIDFVVSNMDQYYNKLTKDKTYIENLGEDYKNIKNAYEKLYDKATIIYKHIKEETPKANKPLSYAAEIELFDQYATYFYNEVYSLN